MDDTELAEAVRESCDEKVKVNYYYFGFFFLFLTLLHIVNILLSDSGSVNTKFFFIVYATAQCFLEILGLVIIGGMVSSYLPRFITPIYIVCTFLLFLSHVVDFPLLRIMDISIWCALDFLPEESPQNFVEMLRASNVSINAWVTGGVVATIFLLFAIVCFHITEKKVSQKPLPLSYKRASITLCLGFAALLLWDVCGVNYGKVQKDLVNEKTLPWKATFFPLKLETFALKSPLKNLKEDVFYPLILPKAKPPIFLIVAESMREDFMVKEISPNLYKFKNENLSFDTALSNANATQMSWFSIFHSKLPFYWSEIKDKNKGSYPLQILKQLGYKIHVYSSSCLKYYEMDERIFGKNCSLADSFHYFPHDEEIPIYKSDAENIHTVIKEIKKSKDLDGNLFIIFLESTHFGYSWPKEKGTVFKPYLDDINYIKMTVSQSDLHKIKNSYRNSIHYIDALFGALKRTLKTQDFWDSSIVIFTGDHGEEFFENGNLFHASGLCKWQTHVPLYYKLGNTEKILDKVSTELTSHLDIFPTVLHYIQGKDFSPEPYHGQSVLMNQKVPYVISARYNASRTPYEFFIHNGRFKILTRFSNERRIFDSKELKILSISNDKDERIEYSSEIIKEQFHDAIHHLFSPN